MIIYEIYDIYLNLRIALMFYSKTDQIFVSQLIVKYPKSNVSRSVGKTD